MKHLLIGLALLPSLFLLGQKYDHLWLIGYSNGFGGSAEDSLGISVLDFRLGDSLNLYPDYTLKLGFNYANVSMCDSTGNYLFSYNGVRVYNEADEWMDGGENLNANENHGYLLPQGVLALPHPRDSNLYAFFHGRKGYGVRVTKTWYSEIDMQENEGLGAVILMQPLVNDTLLYGQFTAVKHGNGRDWWIIFQHYCLQRERCKNNFFYKVLLNSKGVQVFEQKIQDDLITNTGAGQAVFTPDGTKYVAVQGDRFDEPSYIDIYDFDRCTGAFSNRTRIETVITDRGDGENGGTGGVAVSPNSRFLYFNTWKKIFQYDLLESNAQTMQDSSVVVAEYDGFVQYTQSGFPLGTRFLRGQLAPDGKIYICTTNSTQYLHVIHNPNKKGLACNVEQHGIYLPTFNGFSIPNHPNYRLGAWEGSPCDTLRNISSVENIATPTIKVFPNPTAAFLQLELSSDIIIEQLSVHFYSMTGQQVTSFRGQQQFDVSILNSGLYVVEFWWKEQFIGREKVVIQR